MKKLRLLALVAMIFVALAVFTGCDKLKAEEVEADPVKYLTEGSKLTLSETELSPVVEAKDKIAYDLKIEGMGNSADLGVYLDTAAKKGAVEFSSKTGEGENVIETDGTLYYGDKQIVLKSDMLNDVFDTDTVGIDFAFTYDEFKKSGIYGLFDSFGTLDEESEKMLEKLIGKDGLGKVFADLGESFEKLSKEQYEFGEVKEETITVGGKDIKVITVSATLNEDAVTQLIDGLADSIKDLVKNAGGEFTDEDAQSFISTLTGALPEMSGEYKYYLSKKTGALVKLEGESVTEVYDEYFDETTKTENSIEMTFGADPTKEFLPAFKYVTEGTDIGKTTIEGESYTKDGKFVMEVKGTSKINDEKIETEFVCEYGDGKFKIKGDDGEEKYSIAGEIESNENKFVMKLDLSKAYGKDEQADIEKIEFSVTYGKEVPTLPKYKNLLDISVEEITEIMNTIYGSYIPGGDDIDYPASFRAELEWYLDLYEEDLDEFLKKYEEYECASEEEFLYFLYANCAYEDLTTNYGADADVIDAFIADIENNGGTMFDIAAALYDNYYLFAVPTEDELREIFDNYDDYGYDSLQEAIHDYILIYGEYLVIPEEYLN